MSAPVKIIGHYASGYSHRVEAALQLKGVPYELIQEDLSNKSELLLAKNPVHKTVPVLLHGDQAICESLIIVEYIDDAFDGPSLLPADPMTVLWSVFGQISWTRYYKFSVQKLEGLSDHLLALLKSGMMKQLILPFWFAHWAEGVAQKALVEEVKQKLALLEVQLKGKSFFGGDTVGFVDIATCVLGPWLSVVEEVTGVVVLDEDEYPALRGWSKEYNSYGALEKCVPDRDQLVAFYTERKERYKMLAKAKAWLKQ